MERMGFGMQRRAYVTHRCFSHRCFFARRAAEKGVCYTQVFFTQVFFLHAEPQRVWSFASAMRRRGGGKQRAYGLRRNGGIG